MIAVFHWNSENKCGRWLDGASWLAHEQELRAPTSMVWIDLDRPSEEEENAVFGKFLPIHSLSLEDITRQRREPDALPHFPKVEEFPDYLFVIVNPLTEHLLARLLRRPTGPNAADKKASTQLSAILTNRVLITHHYDSVASVQTLRSFLSRHTAQADRGPDYMFHLILDATVDEYAPVLDRVDDILDEVETQIFSKPTQRVLLRLLKVKRVVISLRKTMIYEREVLARMARGEFALIEAREMVYYRNVYDHLVRFTELIETSRDKASDLMQTHLSSASNKLNEIMKVLTMISTTILPMTLIAGIYGMNFAVLPEKDWDHGYPFALGLMGLTGVGSFFFFRWKKWI